jgi:hypothetical protein
MSDNKIFQTGNIHEKAFKLIGTVQDDIGLLVIYIATIQREIDALKYILRKAKICGSCRHISECDYNGGVCTNTAMGNARFVKIYESCENWEDVKQ